MYNVRFFLNKKNNYRLNSDTKSVLSNSILGVISDILYRGSAYLLSVVLAINLVEEDYGYFVFASSLLAYFLVISNFGIESYAILNPKKDIAFYNRLIVSKLYTSICSFFVFTIFIILYYFLNNISEVFFIALLIIALRVLINGIGVDWYYQIKGEFNQLTKSNLIYFILIIGLSYFFSDNLINASIIFSSAYFAKLLYLNLGLKERNLLYRTNISKNEIFEVLKFGAPFLFIVFSQQFSSTFTKILIPLFTNYQALGEFDIYFRFFILFDLILVGAMKFLVPYSVKQGSINILWYFLFFILIIILGCYLFDIHIYYVELFFNKSLESDFPKYLYVFSFLSAISYVLYQMTCIRGMVKKIVKLNFVLMFFAIGINVYFIREFGILGGVFSMLLIKLTECLFMLGLNVFYILKND